MSPYSFSNVESATERRSVDVIQAEISVWSLVRENKTVCAAAMIAGLALGFGAKYIAVAFLILWLAVGGQ